MGGRIKQKRKDKKCMDMDNRVIAREEGVGGG